jgi:hypothetical protein
VTRAGAAACGTTPVFDRSSDGIVTLIHSERYLRDYEPDPARCPPCRPDR